MLCYPQGCRKRACISYLRAALLRCRSRLVDEVGELEKASFGSRLIRLDAAFICWATQNASCWAFGFVALDLSRKAVLYIPSFNYD